MSCSRSLKLGGLVGVSHGIANRASPKGFLWRRLHARPRGSGQGGLGSSGDTRRLLTPQGSPGPGLLSEGIKVPGFPRSFLSAPSPWTSDRSFCVPQPRQSCVLPGAAALSPRLMSPLVVSGRAGPPALVWLLVALWRSWRGEPQVWVTHRCLLRPSLGLGKQPGCALWSKQALPGGPEESPRGARERTRVFDLSFDESSTEFLSLCCVPGILLDALNIVLSSVHGNSLRG